MLVSQLVSIHYLNSVFDKVANPSFSFTSQGSHLNWFLCKEKIGHFKGQITAQVLVPTFPYVHAESSNTLPGKIWHIFQIPLY